MEEFIHEATPELILNDCINFGIELDNITSATPKKVKEYIEMKKYIGTKQIEASPMTRGDAWGKHLLREKPSTENFDDEGYHVRYEDGYESWSPKGVFEKAYKIADTFLDRLHIEMRDLYEKMDKLSPFIESGKIDEVVTDKYQNYLLRLQHHIMSRYINVLECRIGRLDGSPEAPLHQMSFGDAIEILKQGGAIRRSGWNRDYLPPHIEEYPKYTPFERVEYNEEFDLTYILLNDGSVAVTDGVFYEKVSKHTWMKDVKGYAVSSFEINGNKRPYRLHNFLFDKIPEGRIVDHINGNKLDNRLCNLRFVSPRENIANSSSKSGSTSKYKGVSFDTSRSKWISSIQINGRTKHLGRFESEEEAAKAYDKASYAEYGVYARLNFPQDVLPKMFVIKQIPAHIESDVIPKMQSLPQSAKDLILKGKGFIDYTSQCLIYNENTGRADSWVPSISDVFADDWEIVD